MMRTRTVALSGGRVADIAWETGILHGLLESDVDLDRGDLTIGTFAGSFAVSYLACYSAAQIDLHWLDSYGASTSTRSGQNGRKES